MKFIHGHIDDGFPFPDCRECQKPKSVQMPKLTGKQLTDLYNQEVDRCTELYQNQNEEEVLSTPIEEGRL